MGLNFNLLKQPQVLLFFTQKKKTPKKLGDMIWKDKRNLTDKNHDFTNTKTKDLTHLIPETAMEMSVYPVWAGISHCLFCWFCVTLIKCPCPNSNSSWVLTRKCVCVFSGQQTIVLRAVGWTTSKGQIPLNLTLDFDTNGTTDPYGLTMVCFRISTVHSCWNALFCGNVRRFFGVGQCIVPREQTWFCE